MQAPYETTASYIEMQCGSAIDSINHAAWKILTGNADIIVAGGMESYSQFPAKFSMSTPPYRLIPPMPMAPELSPIADENIGMGLTAENLQVMYNISREDQDRFSLRSQVQALKAIEAGYFTDEIVPVMVPQGKKQPPLEFKVDEHPRKTTLEALAALPPAFKKDGTVTAGNASGRNEWVGIRVVISAEKAKELGYEPMARWLSGGRRV
jgi:acetyl-CoA C-acetyltransferase